MRSFILSDEELGKKDDDFTTKGKPTPLRAPAWKAARVAPRKAFKRLAVFFLVATVVYVFIKNIPTDLGPRDLRRPHYVYPDPKSPSAYAEPAHPKQAPPKQAPRPPGASHADQAVALPIGGEYSGPVRFLNLAASLHAIAGTRGSSVLNKNVLFAASSLKSATALFPMACRMGSNLRNYVHFALMGRSEIAVEELRQMNGIDDSCHIIFHDARPDYSSISTEDRLERCVSRALYHINNYMHPQAVLIDSSEAEERFFLRAIRDQAEESGLTKSVIELPRNAEERLSWMAKMDSSALAAWNRINVDILIHAHARASGSLIRLLRSLSAADFTSCAVPHLTIELPEEIDPPVAKFLETFQWPAKGMFNPTNAHQLTLRRRVGRRRSSEETSSVRFLESFWPSDPNFSHVLVLSPQVELGRHFFHYLKYAMLEYRHSSNAIYQAWDQRLFSISLDLPSTNLDGSSTFPPPSIPDVPADADPSTSFLWQAPNSNAALFSGTKWVELHGFVSQLLEAERNLHTAPDILAEKRVSKQYPAWMEHALRLCRARGYWTLYPSPATAASLATVHSELYQPPEEYEKEADSHSPGTEGTLGQTLPMDTLSNHGGLSPVNDLPLLAWDGTQMMLGEFNEASIAYSTAFRRTIGGCEEEATKSDPTAKDLFCANNDAT